jgi:HEPN domain-containing protein
MDTGRQAQLACALENILQNLISQYQPEKIILFGSYYIPTRYPDAIPDSLPSGLPSSAEAVEAVTIAERILHFVQDQLA